MVLVHGMAQVATIRSAPEFEMTKKQHSKEHIKFMYHIQRTYLHHIKSNYPFLPEDHKAIKWCLRNWTVEECMALWDEFIVGDWDFVKDGKMVKVPHTLRSFQRQVRILLEGARYKEVSKKYMDSVGVKSALDGLGDLMNRIPNPPVKQDLTLDQLKKLQEMSK